MKRIFSLSPVLFAVAASVLSAASAQTVINGVTITKPGQPRVTSAQNQAAGGRVVPAFVDSSVPADWVDVRGRVSAGSSRLGLPAGSQVSVNLVDASNLSALKVLSSATFPSRYLPVSYQVVASPRHFTSAGTYALQVKVLSSAGKTLYAAPNLIRVNPAAKRVLADVTVSAVR